MVCSAWSRSHCFWRARMALTHRIGRMSREHRPQPAVGQPTEGQFERWTAAQAVEVIGVLVAAGNGKNPRPQDRGQRMVSRAGSRRSASASSATPPSEVMRPLSKAALTFLRPTLGRSNRRPVSSSMVGVAPQWFGIALVQATKTYSKSAAYATSTNPLSGPV